MCVSVCVCMHMSWGAEVYKPPKGEMLKYNEARGNPKPQAQGLMCQGLEVRHPATSTLCPLSLPPEPAIQLCGVSPRCPCLG